jgi:hypothetical protein
MSRVILLDTGPLGLVTHPRDHHGAGPWLAQLLLRRTAVRIPEIADYELRRELVRAGKSRSIDRLNGFKRTLGYVPLDTDTMLLAADLPDEIELDGQNGFVIMHRGPRLIQGNSRIMPVNILAHGADSPAASIAAMRGAIQPDALRASQPRDAATVASRLLTSGTRSGAIRVEQNTELPQFGIIRALGPDNDFPATAMWVVHWRIHTPLGTVITDPKVPLVFGPTTVQHYPPVGTEFKSATGPVDIYHQDTNMVVGKLTPGQLTAFDVVVTMDDEIPSAMDVPTEYYINMFNKVVADENQKISTEGLMNDYRIPASVLQNK